MTNEMTLEEIKDFLSDYTPYVLQYIDVDTIFFSYNLVDFSLKVGDSLVLSKKAFDDSGDYEVRLETSSFNAVLNSIDYLLAINKPSL